MRGVVLVALAALALAGCGKEEKKRGLGLAGGDGGAPVVIIEGPTTGGAVGPLDAEVEPNDERDQAAPLRIPGGVKGALARPDDIDFYRIEGGPARQVAVKAGNLGSEEGGADWVVELFDADGKPVARSDRGPAGALEGLPNAPLAQGAAYFVAVSQLVKKSKKKKKGAEEADAARAYQLTVEALTPGADEELEPNDKPEAARPVMLSEEKTGYLGWNKDQDLWKLDLTGFAGGFALDVAVDAVDGATLAVDILGADGRVLVARKGQKDRGLFLRGLLPQLGAQFYLARISGSRSNPEQSYRLRATSRSLTDADEAEPNDDVEHAVAAGTLGDGVAGERHGFLDGGDTDVYKFEAGREPLGLTVAIEPPATADVVLRVLGPSGSEIASADNGKAGQREEIAQLVVGRGEVRFIAVSGTPQGDEGDRYVLRWTATVNVGGGQPAQPAQPTQPGEPTDEPPVEDPYGE